MSLALLLVLLFLLAFGVPVAIALGLTALFYMIQRPEFALATMPQKMMTGIDSFPLLAVVFFVLAGGLMNFSGATERLVKFSSALVGRITGGLAHVTVVACAIISGMSGAAAADAAATGSILIPAMVKSGYSRGFAAAITASAATLGPIIPPSIQMVVLGSLTGVSIGRLFLGGFIPGAVMSICLMLAAYVISKRRGYGSVVECQSLQEFGRITWEALPVLAMPIVVIGGMLGGMFTPTEGGAVAAVYSLVLGIIYKGIKWRQVPEMLVDVVVSNAAIMLIISIFSLLGWILAIEEIPQTLASSFLTLTTNPLVFLLIINILLFLLGIPVEPLPLIILLAPVMFPMLKEYGIDPVHFGVIFILNTALGLITPPIGMNMYITQHLAKCTLGEFTREVMPLLVALLVALLIITYVPAVTTFLPNLLMGPAR